MSNHLSYPAELQSLLGQLPNVSVSPQAKNFFHGLIDDHTAQEEGCQIHSAALLDELIRIVQPALPFINTSKIPGYGAVRLQYLLDMGLELATHVHGHDQAMIHAAGAGVSKATSLKGSRTLRRTAIRVLKSLAGKDKAALARLEEAASEDRERPDERARGLDALAGELERVLAQTPADVAADAGLTSSLIEELRQNAKAVLGARSSAKGSRGDISSLYNVMNILDGRVIFELRILLSAMRDARKSDASIPVIKAGRLRTTKKTAKAEAPPLEGGGQVPG